jgi:hypothetical protein
MLPTLKLFRLDLFRTSPHSYDAVCREKEREVRDSGIFDHLDFDARRAAIIEAVKLKYPWNAQLCGWIQTEFADGRFYADLFLSEPTRDGSSIDLKPASYRESFVIGTVEDAPEQLREMLLALPEKMAQSLPKGAYIDSEQFEILVERFDFKRFCGDHRVPLHPNAVAERARRWN